MTTEAGDRNHYSIGEQFIADENLEWVYFELLPPYMRRMIREARFEYAAMQIYPIWHELKEKLWLDAMVEQEMRQMFRANDAELMRLGTQFYDNLVVEFRAERQARIEAAFQRAS